jgi:ATP-binding cassette subfamily B protein
MEKKSKKVSVTNVVWRSWASVFRKNASALILTLVLYNLSGYVDIMLKPTYFKMVVDSLVSGNDAMRYFYLIVMCYLLAFVFSRLGDWVITLSESRIIKDLRDKTMYGLMQKSSHFFANNFSGSLVAKSKRFSQQSEQVIDRIVFDLSKTIVLVLYILVYMFFVNKQIAFIFLVWTTIFVSFTFFISRLRLKFDTESSEKDSKTTGVFSDILSSLPYLRVYSREYEEYNNFKNVTDQEMQARRKAWYLGNLQWGIQGMLVFVLEGSVIFTLINLVQKGDISIGMMVMIQTYIVSLAMNMYSLGQALIRMRTALADAYEMASILEDIKENTEVVEKPNMIEIKNNVVEFKNVNFAYSSSDNILNNFSLKLESGRHYGMVGTSGAGKSTLTKLLLRNYDYQSGNVLIDGKCIKRFSKPTLRSLIAYVPQQPAFPSRKIIEILRLGDEQASEEKVRQACVRAGCEFIWEKFPEGFDTYVGERGVKLSGGEAQRLAIATAIVKDAPIVVMDEPTSALDAETEQIIQASIKSIFAGKTMMVIAHRLSTVAVLDEIVFLKNGYVHQKGTHEDMLKTSSEYKHLWDLQTNPNTDPNTD